MLSRLWPFYRRELVTLVGLVVSRGVVDAEDRNAN